MAERTDAFPPPPKCWSALSWQQLCQAWEIKLRYGGNADVARVAALLVLLGLRTDKGSIEPAGTDAVTGEDIYTLHDGSGRRWTVTPRELSYMARHTMRWFDYPYGDPGEPVVKDEKGKVVKEKREPVTGYVNPNWRDAMQLPLDIITIDHDKGTSGGTSFALPQLACNNLTWEQYRSLQSIAPQLFGEEVSEEQSMQLQAQFLAHCLVPEQKTTSAGDRFAPARIFRYDADRAEESVAFWLQHQQEQPALFHIVFQTYQTAVQYYATVYPLLFNDDGGKQDSLRDALTGEVGTINAVMKYAGYRYQQEVYDSKIPYVLDILNTMTKEAKEIEKIKKKK